jgi:hypothetical protein
MLLESGQVVGNVVLLSQELLWQPKPPNKAGTRLEVCAAFLGIFLAAAECRFESESTFLIRRQ